MKVPIYIDRFYDWYVSGAHIVLSSFSILHLYAIISNNFSFKSIHCKHHTILKTRENLESNFSVLSGRSPMFGGDERAIA